MKKILAVTGIRSEYDILYPIIDRIRRSSDLSVSVVISGAHLSDWHGNTWQRVTDDGFEISDRIDCLLMTDRTTQRVKGVGLLTNALAQTVDRVEPDFLLVVGDREESIATALVGNYMNVVTAHVGGGDPVYGNADDPVRWAVSKLAHVHFTTAKQYSENLVRVGEEAWRIFCVGNPVYARIHDTVKLDMPTISAELGILLEAQRYIVVIMHPLSSEKENAYDQMKITLGALDDFSKRHGIRIVGIRPNTDPGSYGVLRAIEEYAGSEKIKFFKTIPSRVFVNLIRNALSLVGNSSMGLLEAPYYKIPVVNVGNRQKGRLNAGNVEFVDYDRDRILDALSRACHDDSYRKRLSALPNPFGDESSVEKIMAVFRSIDLSDRRWLIKKSL